MSLLRLLMAGAGGAVAYGWNTADKSALLTIGSAGRTLTHNATNARGLARTTAGIATGAGVSYYWEIVPTAAMPNTVEVAAITLGSVATNVQPGSSANGYEYNGINGQKYNSGSGVAYGATYGVGDVIGVVFYTGTGSNDASLTFYKNNVSQGVAFSAIPNGTWFPTASIFDSNGALSANFKTADLVYSPPGGATPVGD